MLVFIARFCIGKAYPYSTDKNALEVYYACIAKYVVPFDKGRSSVGTARVPMVAHGPRCRNTCNSRPLFFSPWQHDSAPPQPIQVQDRVKHFAVVESLIATGLANSAAGG